MANPRRQWLTRPLAHFRVVLYTVVLLLLLEVGLEWRAQHRGYDTLLFGRASATQTEAASRYPFRNPPVAPARRNGALRIWLASASHAEDRYQPLARIFPTRICALLYQTGQACEMLNASHAGAGIRANNAELSAQAETWRPDLAILYQAKIDIDGLAKDSFGPPPPASTQAEPLPHQAWLARLRRGFEGTTLYALLTQGLKTRLMAARPLHDALPAAAEREYARRLREFIRICRAHAIVPVLATFAIRYQDDDTGRFSDETERSLLQYNPYLSKQGWLTSVRRFNAIIRQTAREQGVLLVELAEPMSGRDDWFRDFSHFSAAGHERMAELIVRGLDPQLARSRRVAAEREAGR